jgi:hypothetical protein
MGNQSRRRDGARRIRRDRLVRGGIRFPVHHGAKAAGVGRSPGSWILARPKLRRAWQAHLLSGNNVGIELLQFIDPPVRDRDDHTSIDFTRRGPWHVCMTYPDVSEAIRVIVTNGGAMLSEPTAFAPGRPWVLAYAMDLWGTVLEVMSHSYAEAFSNWPQPGKLERPTLIERPSDGQ